ncbi:amino acid adenylation domain-containing protein [Streptomyces sp. 1222.5]|uniref:AMP-binding protein n=1 Tax=unclassified Streptomyces TaxID=2593676 RepID=UPI000895DAD2|nr:MULTISPECIES: AMP-binding protein [unclassified Streptomyces]PKW00387.1 amino acid adenylation domain-containing protein [Streptomyces sp. 5112.2]SED86818.1 amino acid adenylation domain-containing protein [Streptomyces sp. 1222.5]
MTSAGDAQTLHAAVRRHAEERPSALAVVHGDRTLTYAELDGTADLWAASLASRGVGPGSLVPVLLPRSAELVVAVLAVLKTGAAYALLDPAWPGRRHREVVAQLAAPVLVTGRGVPAPDLGAPVWSVPDATAAGPAGQSPGFRPAEVPATAAACVFFTSGTTGRPKGVVVPHIATTRLMRPGTFARFTPGTVIPLAAAVPWDAFCLELWGALHNGGTSLVVDEPYPTAQVLRDGVGTHGVGTVWLTAGLFNMIVDEDLEAFTGLHQVMTGGERLSVPHVRAFLRRHPGIALINGYGPVESTVFVTTHRITEADCDLPDGIPVGRPVPGTTVHIVDGEICVAGDGLALGYLGDPALTEERFPHLRLDGRPVRVYRTGDLGHLDEDGVLHYRGRKDRQVKLHGHRIEPAEVERQIEQLLPAVSSCRVVVRRDEAGTARGLVAACVPADPGDPLDGALDELRPLLVRYQCPEVLIGVASFPVTANGKVDEGALLRLARPGPAAPAAAVAAPDASDPLLHAVVSTVASVLGTGGVSLDTPFTALGGTSLDMGRVCARLAAELGRPVPVSAFYQHPSARALAQWLHTSQPAAGPAATPTGDVPLTPMQTVYLTRHLFDPTDRTAHCPVVWSVEGELDLDVLEAAVDRVHRRHEVLRCVYLMDPEPVARPVDVPAPVLEMLPAAPNAEAAVSALREVLGEPLELAEADIWRVVLVPLESGHGAVLGCVVHHIAFDGWSEAVLATDLAKAYNALRGTADTPAPLPAPTVAQTHALRTARLALADTDRQRDWLAAQLRDVPALRWPGAPAMARPAPPGRCDTVLDARDVARLDTTAAEAGVTRFVVLLSCYGRLLAALTGCNDFAVGVPVAQRHHSRLESAVGCHIDMACVRLRGEALGDEAGALAAAARAVAGSFAAQDVSFGEVVRLVNPPRGSRSPLFQTLFVLQDNATPDLALDGLTTRFLRPPYFDIPLEVQTEVWPLADGRLRLVVNYRPDAVSHALAHDLLKGLADSVRILPRRARS